MYRIMYDDKFVFDAYDSELVVTEGKMSVSGVNAVPYLDFTISPKHPLYDVIKEREGIVTLYTGPNADQKVFDGEVQEIETDTFGYKAIACVSSLDFLSDTLVRPYSIPGKKYRAKPPSSIEGFFQWLIDQHNSRALDSRKIFDVDVNQGAALLASDEIYYENDSTPSTLSEITDKILNAFGGYLFIRYNGKNRYVDLYSDVHEANTQIIDYGQNVVDFRDSITTKDIHTAVRATGGTPKSDNNTNNQDAMPISLSLLEDGVTPFNDDLMKQGDVVYTTSGVQRYGYHETSYSNNDVLDPEELLVRAGLKVVKESSPSKTLDVKAIDLSMYMDDYEHLQVGQAVRVRSKVHKVDEYLMVESIDLDLNNPEQTNYTLGTSYDTLTGQQSGYLKSLNSSINSAVDKAASISADVKELSTKVPLSEAYEYASSASKTVAPDDGWSSNMPYYIAGKYLWQRVTKHYENNVTTISEPVMITGNSSAVLKIKSTNGLQFKNGIIKTSFYVSVYYGNEVIDTLTDLRLLYGETATLVWSMKSTEDSDPVVIQASDPRLTNNGFQMNITADDVNTKATFYCELYS